MFSKQKKEINRIFYNEYKIPHKINFITNVMNSCKTKEQLDTTILWGKKILWGYNEMMHRKIHKPINFIKNPISILFNQSHLLTAMVIQMSKLLDNNYNTISNKFNYEDS